ncbi:MAG TPA: response regulator [Chitinophaga sp.]|uniref:hybrid sensor histidine kinase/response regulator n=1 Tax=Chitinophaga sp. TaxID=1869181 RepID=UPI002C480447|nr:response regulator [Chitinophaga sp.]HVI45219.1 response regulator [Chitinophaga sp.]
MSIFGTPQTTTVFKKICYLISGLSLTLGLFVYKVLDYQPILYIELFIGGFFFALPSFTKIVGLYCNVIIFFLVLNAALVYYGILLGPLCEVHVLVAFLIGAACLLLKGQRLMFFPISLVILMLLFLEINYYNHWIAPLNIDYKSAIIVRWVVVFTGTALSCITIYFYFKEWVNEKFEKLMFELQRLMQELKQANEAKSIYLRETSHEIRTPLTSIFGIAQLLLLYSKRNHFVDEDVKKEIEYLFQSSFLARQIINNILDLSKIEAGKLNEIRKETIHLKSSIEECIIMHRYVANTRSIKIIFEYDELLPEYVRTDKIALTKIINNLVSNLVKFSPEDNDVHFSVTRKNEQIIFETKNIGHIDSEELKKIFEAFVSDEKGNPFEGTGLGLPITKHLVQLLGGDIKANSENNVTVFNFYIPLEISTKPAHQENDTSEITGTLKGYKILCIEDDPIFYNILERSIKFLGADPIIATNGIIGLKQLETLTPDLILLDAHMPKMNGKEFLLRLRQMPTFKSIPVIVTSGDTFSREREDMLAAGADEYLVKPYLFTDLYALICKYLPPIRILLAK